MTDEQIPVADGTHNLERSVMVPRWLQNLAALSWRILVIAVLLGVLWFMASYLWTITASIIVAVVVAAVFAPAVLRLRARGRSRNAAAGIVWAMAILTIGALLFVLVIAFLPYVVDLVQRIDEGIAAFNEQSESVDGPIWLTQALSTAAEQIKSSVGDVASGIVGSVAETVGILVLATFLLFFFLRDGDKGWMWACQSLSHAELEQITTAGDTALARVGGYLRGTTILALALSISTYVFLLVLDIPLALALAVLTFVATFIPYFGGAISTIAVLLVTLGATDVPTTIVMTALLTVRSMFVTYYLRPRVFERTVHLHPALVLIVLPAGYAVAGLVGLFAAVPLTAVILTTAQATVDLIEPDDPPQMPDLVPAWLDRVAQWSWRLLVAFGLVALAVLILTTVPFVVVPLVLALIFAAVLQPLMDRMVAGGRSRGHAALISVLGSTAVIVGILTLTVFALASSELGLLGGTATEGAESIDEAAGGNLALASEAFSSTLSNAIGSLTSLLQALAAIGTIAILSVLLTYYFLRDGANLWASLMAHTRKNAVEPLSNAGREAYGVLSGYMIGTGAISLVGAGSQAVIMWILGLPLVLPVFVLSFFGGFIPYIGSFLTTMLAFLIAVAVGDTIDIVIMLIWTVVFNLVQGNVVAPLVYGRTTHIHPAVVLVAIPAGAAVAGILGIFIVVPALGVVAVTWRTILGIFDGRDQTPIGDEDTADADADAEPPPEDSPPEPVVV